MKYRIIRVNVDPVPLQLAKDHCRVTSTREDSIIKTYIRSATLIAENYIDALIMVGTVEEQLAEFGNIETKFQVKSTPVIKYYDTSGDLQTLSDDVFTFTVNDNSATIRLKENQSWPDVQKDMPLPIFIKYDSGMYEIIDDVPSDMVNAILLIIGRMYENREDFVDKLPTASKNILHPYRNTWL